MWYGLARLQGGKMDEKIINISDLADSKNSGQTMSFYLDGDTLGKFGELKKWLEIESTTEMLRGFIKLMHVAVSKCREGYVMQLTKEDREPIIVKLL